MTGGAAGIARQDITLGLLAGGRATRLGGRDKAWLERGGQAQVLRLSQRFGAEAGAVLVSANRDLPRYAQAGLATIADRIDGAGPLGGLDALASACRTPWLLTLPVDLVDGNDCLVRSLVAAAGDSGVAAQDDSGLQPLVALWRLEALRTALAAALDQGALAVRALQARMGMGTVRFAGVRFGNLNTPDDLRAAGIDPP